MMRLLTLAAVLLVAVSSKIIKPQYGELVEDEFIVVLQPNVTTVSARDHHLALLGPSAQILFTYDIVLNGYAVRADEHLVEKLSEQAEVLYVEQSQRVYPFQTCQTAPPNTAPGMWGLSRVSYRQIVRPPGPARFFSNSQGADIYFLDSGIYLEHENFGGRVSFVADFVQNRGPGDRNGHGTHCAGLAAGSLYGISRSSRIFDIKVICTTGGEKCSQTFAPVIMGLDYVASQSGPRIASMSLGGGISQAVNDAVDRLVSVGALAVSASGNSNANACNTSPASARGSITVNAINDADARSTFSNWGTCTHLFAPGQSVLSSWIGSPTATNVISGTSMACPIVSGILAAIWGRNPSWTNEQVRARLFELTLSGVVTNPGTGSPNRVAQADCAL
jgi:subtilisin family serine protease